MTEDEQEAKSVRYVDALRVVPLASGRWAVFKLAGAIHPEIMERLDEGRLREIMLEQKQEQAQIAASIRFRKPPAASKGTVSINLEDLFG